MQQLFRRAKFPLFCFGGEHFSVTPTMIRELRVLPYVDQWKLAMSNEWFHIKTEDNSLLVFNEGDTGDSFSFLHCPLDVPSFRNYLKSLGIPYNAQNCRDFKEDYQQVIETASLRAHISPIRYDRDANGYRKGAHPYAHIHLGLDNDIRLGLRKLMTPTSFTLFVMRQMYPQAWENLIEHHAEMRLAKLLRNDCSNVGENYWHELDGLELALV